jgi:hypothetical protein
MSAITSHYSNCASELEADSTFCPDCGTPKLKHAATEAAQPSYPWMNDQRSAAQYSSEQKRTSQPLTTYYPPPSPIQQAHYQQPATPPVQSSGLASFAMAMGIVTACLMIVGLIPCLGWMNWIVFFLGGITNILNWVVIFTDRTASGRNKAIIGLVLTFVALFIGLIRLILGGGCV